MFSISESRLEHRPHASGTRPPSRRTRRGGCCVRDRVPQRPGPAGRRDGAGQPALAADAGALQRPGRRPGHERVRAHQDTIWLLADALGPWRLSLAALGPIATLVVWLIADHELWERRNGYAARLGHPIGLYNAATVITGLLGVVSLYVALVGAELPGSEVFTVNTVLADSLQHPVDRFRRRRGGTRSRPGQVQRFLATTASRSIPPATRARKMTRSMSSSTTRSMACLPVVRRAAGRGAAPRTGTTTATAEPTS